MNTILRVEKCTNSSNGGFIVTYSAPTKVETPLGVVVRPFGKKYLAKLEQPVEVGQTFHVDLTQFNIREQTFVNNEGIEKTVSWLDPK